jgi:hypothetical protein
MTFPFLDYPSYFYPDKCQKININTETASNISLNKTKKTITTTI